ncbi:hypothetical protein M404DRAFT_1000219, partial [Pisolithus tinctorius Marx 270]
MGPSLSVVVLNDDTLNADRSSYNDSRSEKPARGTLFTVVQRNLAQNKTGFWYRMCRAAMEIKVLC